jgi:hypothetical protein
LSKSEIIKRTHWRSLALVNKARSAVEQIEVAITTMRDNRNAADVKFYEAQLPKARSLLDRLTSGSQ